MAYFRLYVFDRESHALRSFDLIALDRAVAARRVRQELAAVGGVACEVWQVQAARQGGKRSWALAYQHKRDETANWQAAGVRLSVARDL